MCPMGYQSRRGSPRGSGRRFVKEKHDKARAKLHKPRGRSKVLQEERVTTSEEIAEKTLNSLKRLGDQRFAVSPFSQYFDDWLINVKQVLSEFESSPTVKVNEVFVKERQRLLTALEQKFAELRKEEATLNKAVGELADNNHLLVETDVDYAAKTREIGSKRNVEIQNLTLKVQNLEAELERVKGMKTSFFGFTKKAKAQKQATTLRDLESAKAKLESVVQAFKADQEKLHDEYEKKKQVIIERVQQLEKEVEKLETDNSLTVRHDACDAFVRAIADLLKRQPSTSS